MGFGFGLGLGLGLANPHPNANQTESVRARWSKAGDGLRLVTARALEAGEAVRLDFGPRSNGELLVAPQP